MPSTLRFRTTVLNIRRGHVPWPQPALSFHSYILHVFVNKQKVAPLVMSIISIIIVDDNVEISSVLNPYCVHYLTVFDELPCQIYFSERLKWSDVIFHCI